MDERVEVALDAMPQDIRGRFERIVVVHVFVKKAQRTPRRDIETALARAGEVE